MAIIVDRRQSGKNKSAGNRKRFLDRYKAHVKEAMDRAIKKKSMKDVSTETEVTVENESLGEPTFRQDPDKGITDVVLPGNKKFTKGDQIKKGKSESKGSAGSAKGSEEDDYSFILTKDEFMDLYFSDMELPNFVKENVKRTVKYVRRRAGYIKEGCAAQLNLKKSFENSIARRLCADSAWKKILAEDPTRVQPKSIFLDDTDLRYNYFKKFPKPAKMAVMFCLMDVSGSMEAYEKDLAKRFFLLLYLFLHKSYKHVEVRFIRHHDTATECDEQTFFYSKESGGTIVSSALEVMLDIIKKDYKSDDINIYVAQASDGDNFDWDNDKTLALLSDEVLPKVQYYAYIQVCPPLRERYSRTLLQLYQALTSIHRNFKTVSATRPKEIFEVLRSLFRKGEGE